MKNKKIGIWGYGVTGKAAANYYLNQGFDLSILDKKELNPQDLAYLHAQKIDVTDEYNLITFLESSEHIMPSPGIDLRPYSQYQSKWLSELDEFYKEWRKPIIAITGSIGKTTITHLLSKLLEQSGNNIATGGNIGTPLFDLLANKKFSEYALVELSSFQLELTKCFAPDLAILTNFYPNHLDRHGSQEEYFNAKAKLFLFQNMNQKSLIPLDFKNKIKTSAHKYYFSLQKPNQEQIESLHNQAVYYIDNNNIFKCANNVQSVLISFDQLPRVTFQENWLILIAALDILNISLSSYSSMTLALPAHRMEKVATLNGIDFINDSKSTTAQSTLAAIKCLQGRPILLLLGGKGKGISREPLIHELKNDVKKIYCFGAEAQELHSYCSKYAIESSVFENLDQAFNVIAQEMMTGDQVLLSPAGTSYDLYTIFSERGDHFKRLVHNLEK